MSHLFKYYHKFRTHLSQIPQSAVLDTLVEIKVQGNKLRRKVGGKGRDGGFWKNEIVPSRQLDTLYEMMLTVLMNVPSGFYRTMYTSLTPQDLSYAVGDLFDIDLSQEYTKVDVFEHLRCLNAQDTADWVAQKTILEEQGSNLVYNPNLLTGGRHEVINLEEQFELARFHLNQYEEDVSTQGARVYLRPSKALDKFKRFPEYSDDKFAYQVAKNEARQYKFSPLIKKIKSDLRESDLNKMEAVETIEKARKWPNADGKISMMQLEEQPGRLNAVLSDIFKPIKVSGSEFEGMTTFDQLQTFTLTSQWTNRWNQGQHHRKENLEPDPLESIDNEELAKRLVYPAEVEAVLDNCKSQDA